MANDTQIFSGILIYLILVIIVLTAIFTTSPVNNNINVALFNQNTTQDFRTDIPIENLDIYVAASTQMHYSVSSTRGLFMDYKATGIGYGIEKWPLTMMTGGSWTTFGNVSYVLNGQPIISEKYWLKGMTSIINPNDDNSLYILVNDFPQPLLLDDTYSIRITDVGNGYNTFYIHEKLVSGTQDIIIGSYPVSDSYNFTYSYNYVTGMCLLYDEKTQIASIKFNTYTFTTSDALQTYEAKVRPHMIIINNYDMSIISAYDNSIHFNSGLDFGNALNVLASVAIWDFKGTYLPAPLQFLFITVPEIILILIGYRLVRGLS